MNKIIDLDSQPLIAIWETSVSSVGCRDQNFRPASSSLELNDNEAEQLIRDVADLKPPVFVFAGDNPLSRSGIFSLVQYAASCNLHPSNAFDARLGSNSTDARCLEIGIAFASGVYAERS